MLFYRICLPTKFSEEMQIYEVPSFLLIRKPIVSQINPVYNPSILFLYYYYYYYSDLFLPTHCRSRGLLLHLVTLIDTHTHTHTHSVGLL